MRGLIGFVLAQAGLLALWRFGELDLFWFTVLDCIWAGLLICFVVAKWVAATWGTRE